MNTYKYFDMKVRYRTNNVKPEYINVHHQEVELSKPGTYRKKGTYRKDDGGCLPIELIDINFQIFLIVLYISKKENT